MIVNWQDVVGRYKELSVLGGAPEVNSVYIHPAEKEIESMLAGYYTVPFSSNNETAKDLAVDLVFVRYFEDKQSQAPRAAAKLKRVMDRIERLKNGVDSMIIADGTVMTSDGLQSVAYSTTMDYHPVFGVGEFPDMLVSSSQIVDEEDARV